MMRVVMFKTHLDRLERCESGNFGMMAAIAMVPLVMAAGVAIDFSSISNRHSELQNALDAAAIAIAREGDLLPKSEAMKIAESFVGTNFDIDYTDLDVLRVGSRVTVEATARQKLVFSGVLGYDEWPVNGSASADIAYNYYEIALVLDTTGSMFGGKLSSMKDAVIGLVDTMSSQIKDPDKLKFAVVPFANFVNVGNQYGPEFLKNGKIRNKTGADWLDLKGRADFPQTELPTGLSRFELFNHLGQPWRGCVETRYATAKKPHDVADTRPDPKDPSSLFVPAFSIDEPEGWGYPNSYILSDADPLDKSATGVAKKLAKYGIPNVAAIDPVDPSLEWTDVAIGGGGSRGPNRDCLTQPILPLGNDYAKIKKMVNSLQANGTTNIMEGVAWGMRVLSPGEPFTQGSPDKPGLERIMIVLTDGSNVFGNNGTKLGSTYSSNGYLVDGRLGITAGSSSDTNKLMNEKTLAACENAKKAGTTVYTIRLEEPDVKTGMMLKECATSLQHFFDAPSRSQLDEVFKSIRDDVVRLRISS
jgi:Flp pilus assembly protein TadG